MQSPAYRARDVLPNSQEGSGASEATASGKFLNVEEPLAELSRPALRYVFVDYAAFGRSVADYAGRRGVLACLFVGMGAMLEGVGILLLVPIFDTIFEPQHNDSGLSSWIMGLMPLGQPAVTLTILFAGFALLMGARAAVLWRRDTLLGALQVGYVESRRTGIARRLAGAEWRALAHIGHARINHLMGADIQRCGIGVAFLLNCGSAAIMLMVTVGLAFSLAPALAGLTLVAMASGSILMMMLLRAPDDVARRVTAANLALATGLQRFLVAMKMAMSQNLQHTFVSRFEHDIALTTAHQVRFLEQQARLRALWSIVGACIAIGVVLAGYALFKLPGPTLLAFLALLARTSGPAAQLQLGLRQIAYAIPPWRAVASLEAELAAVPLQPVAAGGSAPLVGRVELDNIGYSHDREGRCGGGVHGVSMCVDPQEIVGISGASGSGKTTLADLLAGLIQPDSGQILVGGRPLTEENAAQWRDSIAYVSQDPVLFNESIRANLRWGAPEATDDKMLEALAVAGADNWVAHLPQGLDTTLGELGTLISGGERQRLALARALLRAPSMLILDEATGAIDVAAEREIFLRLRQLDPRPMIVLIAHRGESLAHCDRILTMAGGRLTSDVRPIVA